MRFRILSLIAALVVGLAIFTVPVDAKRAPLEEFCARHPTHPHCQPTTTTVPPTTTTTTASPSEWPGPTNTGVPAGTVLTTHVGDFHTSAAGQVIDSLYITGTVFVDHPDVTIRRTKIRANSWSQIWYTQTGLVVEDTEIDCADVSGSTGMGTNNFTVRRANIHHCENGFNVGANVYVSDSYVHDPFNGADAHADGAQFVEAAGPFSFIHNYITIPGGTSAFIMDLPGHHDFEIRDNLLSGGAYTMYGPASPAPNSHIVNNRFKRDFAFGPWTGDRSFVTEFVGNVYDDTGTPI